MVEAKDFASYIYIYYSACQFLFQFLIWGVIGVRCIIRLYRILSHIKRSKELSNLLHSFFFFYMSSVACMKKYINMIKQ